jgi:hypothetical protein
MRKAISLSCIQLSSLFRDGCSAALISITGIPIPLYCVHQNAMIFAEIPNYTNDYNEKGVSLLSAQLLPYQISI